MRQLFHERLVFCFRIILVGGSVVFDDRLIVVLVLLAQSVGFQMIVDDNQRVFTSFQSIYV